MLESCQPQVTSSVGTLGYYSGSNNTKTHLLHVKCCTYMHAAAVYTPTIPDFTLDACVGKIAYKNATLHNAATTDKYKCKKAQTEY